MKYLKNESFQKDLKNNSLNDEDIKVVLDDVFKGRAIPLGAKMYKIRGAMINDNYFSRLTTIKTPDFKRALL